MACTACWLWLWIVGFDGGESPQGPGPSSVANPGSGRSANANANAAAWRPRVVAEPSWRAVDLTRDANMESAFALSLAFGRDGSVWAATTDGLRGSDGYSWRRYDENHGLPSRFVRCAHVDREGTVWAGTDRGAAKLVGGQFAVWGPPQGLVGPSVRRIRSDSSGALWFCCDRWPNPHFDAGLTRLTKTEVRSWTSADGLPDSHVYDYHCDAEGRDFAFTSKGLAQRRGDRWFNPIAEAGLAGASEPCWSAAESPKHGLLVASRGAIFQRKADRWRRFEASALINRPFAGRDGEIFACLTRPESLDIQAWSGTEGRFVAIPEATFATPEPIYDSARSPDWVEDCGEAPDGSIWACDQGTLVRWVRGGGEWTEFADLPAPRFRDSLDRVWFVDDRGAARRDCVGDRWERLEGFRGDDVAIATDGRDAWSWTSDRLRHWSDSRSDRVAETTSAADLGMARIERVAVDGENQAWIWGMDAQGENRAATRPRGSDRWRVVSLEPLADDFRATRLAAAPRGAGFWSLGTTAKSGCQLAFLSPRAEVRVYDLGPHLQRAAKQWFVEWSPALLAAPPSMAVDSEGRVWICGLFGVMTLGLDGRWSVADPSELPGRWIFECFENQGSMWFFTRSSLGGENGVAIFRDGSWRSIASGRDTPRLLSRDFRDSAVVMGLGRFIHSMPDHYNSESRTGPFRFVKTANPYRGQLERGAAEPDGTLWLSFLGPSGERKVRRYRPDGAAPETRIEAAAQSIHEGESLAFRAWGVERFRPRGDGARYRYSWRLDDQPWREFEDQIPDLVANASLTPGPHRLEAQAIDEGGDIDSTPAVAMFEVLPTPLQTRSWFLPAVGAVCAALAFLTAASGALAHGMRRSWAAADFASRAKSAFLAGMSHELRTPLNAVNGWARLLLETGERDAEARGHLESIVVGSENLRHRINDILDFTALESGKLVLADRPFRLIDGVEQGLAAARQNATAKGLRFSISFDNATPNLEHLTLRGDPDRFAQILNNLAANAALYTERGEVVVRVSAESSPSSSRRPRTRVRITIQDTGDGIAQDRLEQLFKPFQRGDDSLNRKESGLGLGLTVSRGLAALMDGVILAESQPGRGSAFIFEAPFPVVASPSGSRSGAELKRESKSSEGSTPNPELNWKVSLNSNPKPELNLGLAIGSDSKSDTVMDLESTLRILLAEDLEMNRRLLQAMLKRLGYEADIVSNGQEALEAVQRRGYDAILMDLQMPVMDGLEASRRILNEVPEHERPWIIAVTANFADEDSGVWRDAGIVDHLPKPIQTDELTQCLARASHWSRSRGSPPSGPAS